MVEPYYPRYHNPWKEVSELEGELESRDARIAELELMLAKMGEEDVVRMGSVKFWQNAARVAEMAETNAANQNHVLIGMVATLEEKLESTQKQAAAMREVLISHIQMYGGVDHHRDCCHEDGGCSECKLSARVEQALSSDAGREFVRREDMSTKPENIDTSQGHVDGEYVRREELDRANNEIAVRVEDMNQLRAERDGLEKENETLEQERDELKKELEDWKSKCDWQRVTLDDQEDTNGMLGRMLSDREDELNAARAECAALREALTDYGQHVGRCRLLTEARDPCVCGLDGFVSGAPIGTAYRERVERLVKAVRENRRCMEISAELERALKEFEG